MQVIFSNRAYMAIIAETAEKIKTETGGIFLGYYENETWYVIEAIDPGPKSVFQVAYFEYDRKYTEHLINKIARLYQEKLTLIGLWHRHPGSFDEFSSTDGGTNSDYAKLSPHGAISILVNIDPKFRLTPYHVSLPLRYIKIPYKIGDEFIPKHLFFLKDKEKSIDFINNYDEKSHSSRKTFEKPKADFVRLLDAIKSKFESTVLSTEDYKQEEAEKHLDFLIDKLLDDITYFSENRGLALKVLQDKGIMCLAHKGSNGIVTKVHFVYLEHKKQIVFVYGEKSYLYKNGMFAELLADYQPPSEGFKSEFMRAIGIKNLNL